MTLLRVGSIKKKNQTYLTNHSDHRSVNGLRYSRLHQVHHVLVGEQTDQMKGAERAGGSKSQVADQHGPRWKGQLSTPLTISAR